MKEAFPLSGIIGIVARSAAASVPTRVEGDHLIGVPQRAHLLIAGVEEPRPDQRGVRHLQGVRGP